MLAIGMQELDAAGGEALRQLLAEPRFLPVPLFDTRIVHISAAVSADGSFAIQEALCAQPGQTKELQKLRDLHWALGVLCSTSTAMQPHAMKQVVSHCRKIAAQAEHGGACGAEGFNMEAAEAGIYRAIEASFESYWTDVGSAFTAAYDALKGMPGEQINRLQGATDNQNYVQMKRVACTPSRMILLPPTPMQLAFTSFTGLFFAMVSVRL